MVFFIILIYAAAFYFSCVPKIKQKAKREYILCTVFLCIGLIISLLSINGVMWANPLHALNDFFNLFLPPA
jgi:hypothetical protein